MTRMQRAVHVVGVGMIPFTKPGASAPYHEMGAQAARLALDDAGVDYAKVQQAYVGYVYGDSTAGQAAIYGVGLSGIPVFNVNNNCSTGSSALFLARQAVELLWSARRPLFISGRGARGADGFFLRGEGRHFFCPRIARMNAN